MNASNYTFVSGGQSGVDRALLDFALKHKLAYRGWIPKGRLAEDGRLPEHLNLQETKSEEYIQRTEWNVRDSDVLIVIYLHKPDQGTHACIAFAETYKKPYLLLSLKDHHAIAKATHFLTFHPKGYLHIAGSRESSEAGIYQKTDSFLEELFFPTAQ